MNYERLQHTAYGLAKVSGENAFPQPAEPTFASNRRDRREVHDKIVASAQRCIDYKQAREKRRKALPEDKPPWRVVNDMYRSMTLAAGPANLNPIADMPKTRETLRRMEGGD